MLWTPNDEKLLKFIYSEKAANFCKISTVDLSYVVTVKSTVEISQNFVAFSGYMNCTMIYVQLRPDFIDFQFFVFYILAGNSHVIFL